MTAALDTAKVVLIFGAMADPLAKQLKGRGLEENRIAKWQREADAITLLSISGLIRDPEKTRARERLARTIRSALEDQCAQP
jgi:hypothetical protein